MFSVLVLLVFRMCSDDVPLFLFMLSCTGGKTPDPKVQVRSYVDVMREQNLSKEEVSYFALYINKRCSIFIVHWISNVFCVFA